VTLCLPQELPDVRALQVQSQQLQVDQDSLERKRKYKAAEVTTTKQEITAAQVRAMTEEATVSLSVPFVSVQMAYGWAGPKSLLSTQNKTRQTPGCLAKPP
jgi:hypothetical protein